MLRDHASSLSTKHNFRLRVAALHIGVEREFVHLLVNHSGSNGRVQFLTSRRAPNRPPAQREARGLRNELPLVGP